MQNQETALPIEKNKFSKIVQKQQINNLNEQYNYNPYELGNVIDSHKNSNNQKIIPNIKLENQNNSIEKIEPLQQFEVSNYVQNSQQTYPQNNSKYILNNNNNYFNGSFQLKNLSIISQAKAQNSFTSEGQNKYEVASNIKKPELPQIQKQKQNDNKSKYQQRVSYNYSQNDSNQSLIVDDGKYSLKYKLQNSLQKNEDERFIGPNQNISFKRNKNIQTHKVSKSQAQQIIKFSESNSNKQIKVSIDPMESINFYGQKLQKQQHINSRELKLGDRKKTQQSIQECKQINKSILQQPKQMKGNENNSAQNYDKKLISKQIIEHAFIVETSKIKFKKKDLKNLNWINEV